MRVIIKFGIIKIILFLTVIRFNFKKVFIIIFIYIDKGKE